MTWGIRRWLACFFLVFAFAAPVSAQTSEQESDAPNDIDRILTAWRTERALEMYEGACDLPPASAREEIVLFSAYGSGRIANVTLTTQNEQYRVGDIAIERGRRPIYLIIVTEEPVIWRFSGATNRLRTLVLITPSVNGYTGARPRTYRAQSMFNCFSQFGDAQQSSALVAAGIVTRELGRAPDIVAHQQRLDMSLPTGELTPPPPIDFDSLQGPPALPPAPPGFDDTVYRQGFPHVAELVMIDPGSVRGAQATPYEIMPGWLGLAQLTGSGALEALPDAGDGWRNFRVKRALSLPPNISFRDYTIRFYLPPGAPMPSGDLTGLCLVDEATGNWVGPITEFCAERHAWMRSNIEAHQRSQRAQENR